MEKVNYYCASQCHAPALITMNLHVKRHEKSFHLLSNRVIEVTISWARINMTVTVIFDVTSAVDINGLTGLDCFHYCFGRCWFIVDGSFCTS